MMLENANDDRSADVATSEQSASSGRRQRGLTQSHQ